ncbi:MAG: 1-deoxy-D-xylulose-5-phosphate reductoisomerase [Atribacterota bacterium]|nr:1-deoxy-D-xylulose-5-phosphate reductoisomerase [Atribacterota bacterium]
MKKKLTILGSTGSIGRQTMDIIQNDLESFEVVALAGWNNIDLLTIQINKFRPKYVVVKDDKVAKELKNRLKNRCNCNILYGEYGLNKISAIKEIETVVVAITGMAALKPTIEAINAKKEICLANKEIVVSAGEVLTVKAKQNGVNLIPIDSEHSGIFQCIQPQYFDNIEKIIITASGGPFYNLKETALENVSVEDALNHPNWKMGSKVSIDSATLMNKGLEVIEAHWLFGITVSKIEILVHPQSYIHALVQYDDGSMITQLSNHDMHIPIHFALYYPRRVKNNFSRINLAQIGQLTFRKIDTKRFPSIDLCYDAIKLGGTAPAVLNAANEVAVNAFLNKSIKFKNIIKIVSTVMSKHKNKNNPDIYDIINIDKETRKLTEKLCDEIK